MYIQLLFPTESAVFTVYSATGHNMKMYCGDVLRFLPCVAGQFDGMWDCNALVAMNVENRQEYIDLLVSLLKPGGKILLTTWEYERNLHSGPPFSMDGEDVRQSFESVFEIEHLQATDLQQDHFFCKVHPHLPWAKQHAFLLTKRV